MTASDLSACEREPIHAPGGIQPHGYLLVVDETTMRVIQVSANLDALVGAPVDTVLGAPLDAILGHDCADRVTAALARRAPDVPLGTVPLYLGEALIGAERFELVLHRNGTALVLELERRNGTRTGAFASIYPLVRGFVTSLQDAPSVEVLAERAVVEIRRISGFGRALLYRFDEDGHGVVLAEDADDGYERYLHHHFPASDIPAQARALYLKTHLRLIADANYVPVPLVPVLNPMTRAPTDLSASVLRSVSPVHVEYMRNMGTIASMSVSLIVRGELWGMISCHDRAPRHPDFGARMLCEHLGHMLSLQIEAKEESEDAAYRETLRHTLVELLASMAEHTIVADGLAAHAETLLKLGASGGAAIAVEGHVTLLGQTPPASDVLAIVDWLAEHAPTPVFSTYELGAALPDTFPDIHARASGMLAVSMSQMYRHYVIWFRPEARFDVAWAGEPVKREASASDGSGAPHKISPRRSFATWHETIRGRSTRWRTAEIDTAHEFRTALLGFVLRRAEEMAALASELGRANKELEAFSYSVSHDLRAPLRHIVGYGDLLGEFEGERLSERGQRFLSNVLSSARFAGALVDDLLSFSQLGRAALRVTEVDLQSLVEALIAEAARDLEGREVEWRVAALPHVHGDAAFLQIVLRSLVSNALKYSRTRRPAIIELGAQRVGDDQVVFVRDNGVGFDMKYVDKLFGVFQRLHRIEEFEGTGIGLANVRRIVERHDGRTWAEGKVDEGATFFFSLPVAGPADPAALSPDAIGSLRPYSSHA
ncbi:GAF domain-containing protein [Pararobbsia silviterrae]|uniref:histidine kinase n=2 Tax=Pararobbsia silviterrae TaxID=1792498 RepID=A0A494Y0Q4_9BURK|nr:GAF domain-containing protein [Pararobbsia silviterrae]